MALNQRAARQIITIGSSQLVFAVVAVICAAIMMSKMTQAPHVLTAGLWALYFVIPGSLCIVTGLKKSSSMMVVSLCANIFGCIVAVVGAGAGSFLWWAFNYYCVSFYVFDEGQCACPLYLRLETYYYYEASCSDLAAVKGAIATITIVNIFMLIFSFIGSIFGCIGTCCSPRQPGVVIATEAPVQPGMVMTAQTTSYGPPPYSAQQGYPATMPQQQVQYPGGEPQQTKSGTPNVAYSGDDVTIKSAIS